MDKIVFIAASVLVTLDLVTTCWVLWHMAGGKEGNGPLAWLMRQIGVFPALLITHGVGIAAMAYSYVVGALYPTGYVVAAVYGFTVLSNFMGIFTGRTLIQRIL